MRSVFVQGSLLGDSLDDLCRPLPEPEDVSAWPPERRFLLMAEREMCDAKRIAEEAGFVGAPLGAASGLFAFAGRPLPADSGCGKQRNLEKVEEDAAKTAENDRKRSFLTLLDF